MSDKFKSFTKEIMISWPDGGVDGFELQDIAERHGIIISTKQFDFCSDGCACADVIEHPEVGFECFRLCDELKGDENAG